MALTLTLAEYTILAANESLTTAPIGGVVDPPSLRTISTLSRVTEIDLRVQTADIQTARPPATTQGSLRIRSITVNARRYTTIAEWTRAWSLVFQTNNPQLWSLQQAAPAERRGVPGYIDPDTGVFRALGEHEIQRSEILVPGTGQTLDQLLPPGPQALNIVIPPVTEPTLPEPDLPEAETQPSVIAVDLNEEGQLVTTLSDSSQEIVGTVVETALPPGSIISYYGNFALIPEGWVLCDGTNDTPDLSSSFILDPDPDRQFFYIKKI